MAQIIVRNLAEETVQRLKERAKQHHRSLEAEVRSILESAPVGDEFPDRASAIRFADAMREELVGRIEGDSADLIREERDR